jgi:PAS domain S-box-containing protein
MKGVLDSIKLSRQEEQVLVLSMSGLGDREVGEAMSLSTETVRTYWKRIRKKLDGGTRAEIIALLSQRGVRAELEAKQTENELLLKEIARRRQAEAQLQYQLGLVKSITDGAADAIFMLDARGRVTFSSLAATQIFGWNPDELEGKVFHEVFHHHRPDGREYPIAECPLQLVLRNDETVRNHEDQFFDKKGKPVAVSCSNAPIKSGGKVTGAVLIVRDVTEEKASARALQMSELRYKSLFENTLNPIFLMDHKCRCLDANQAVTKVFGYSRKETVGKDLCQTVLGPRALELVEAVRAGGPWTGSWIAHRADGSEVNCFGLAQPDRAGPDAYIWLTLRPEG